jgi:hypothetical protein
VGPEIVVVVVGVVVVVVVDAGVRVKYSSLVSFMPGWVVLLTRTVKSLPRLGEVGEIFHTNDPFPPLPIDVLETIVPTSVPASHMTPTRCPRKSR